MRLKRTISMVILAIMIFLQSCRVVQAAPQPSGLPPTEPASTLAPGATSEPPLPGPEFPGVASMAKASIEELVEALLAGDPLNAVLATQEALARGGVPTVDMERVLVEAYAPAAYILALPAEMIEMASEASQRPASGRISLDELALMLVDAGWPLAETGTAGEQLIGLLAAWIAEAAKEPASIHSFTPLFLGELARRQMPAADLASGRANPQLVRWTLLEMHLFTAAFLRPESTPLAAVSGGRLARPLAPDEQASRNAAHPPGLPGPAPAVVESCDLLRIFLWGPGHYFTSRFNPMQRSAGDSGTGMIVGEMLSRAIKSVHGEATANRAGNFLTAVQALARVLKMLMIYAGVDVSVSLEGENPTHKPSMGAVVKKNLTARVAISPLMWEAYRLKAGGEVGMQIEKVLRDCANLLGIPIMPSTGEIAEQMGEWSVEWRIMQFLLEKEHLKWEAADQSHPGAPHQGYWRGGLTMESATSGRASFVVRLTTEEKKNHPGIEIETQVLVCAQLDTSEGPGLSTFASSVLGAAGSAAELLIDMLQKVNKPSKCAPVGVTYHEPAKILVEGNVTVEDGRRMIEIDPRAYFQWKTTHSFSVLMFPDDRPGDEGGTYGTGEITSVRVSESNYPAGCDTCSHIVHCSETASGSFEAIGRGLPLSDEMLTLMLIVHEATLYTCFLLGPEDWPVFELSNTVDFLVRDGRHQEIQFYPANSQQCSGLGDCSVTWDFTVRLIPFEGQ